MVGVKKNRTEKKKLRGWADGPMAGGGEHPSKKGIYYTQGIYFYTYLHTHLDIVHVKIYAIHTPASCQVPQEPAVALVGMGEQMGVC